MTTLVLLSVGKFPARPRLVLYFDRSSDAYTATSTHPEGNEPSITRKYLRVSLRAAGLFGTNLGGSSGAAKCLIYITAIQPVVNGSAGNDQLYDARPVSWPPNKTFDPSTTVADRRFRRSSRLQPPEKRQFEGPLGPGFCRLSIIRRNYNCSTRPADAWCLRRL